MSSNSFTITVKGQVRRPGAYTVASGENLLDATFARAGGMATGRFPLKAVLAGGPQGRFAAAAELTVPLTASQEIMVFDAGSCLVNVVRLLLTYNLSAEAGYKGCPACRSAMAEAADLLAGLSTSAGTAVAVEKLAKLAETASPDCPDGCAGLRPLASALALWAGEFAEHGTGHCQASICSELMLSPCANSCPAGVDLAGTLALLQLGKYADAVALGRHDNPLFLTCGHVCEAPPCQKNCKRLSFDEAVYSQSLHRYAGEKAAKTAGGLDQALKHVTIQPGQPSGKKVAVVGAGPAGLAAAYFLARLGHKVVIYEKNPQAGGMTVFGIPAYRLPRAIIEAEVAAVAALGVEIRTGCALGEPEGVTLDGLKEEYDAVLLAIGNSKSRSLGLAGENLPGVTTAVDFLRQVALTGTAAVGQRVLVVGGGNVAVDVARTARRLGGEQVTMMCVEDKFEMPASPGEIAAAEAEGIALQLLAVPVALAEAGGSVKVTWATITPGPYDALGRRWPPAPQPATASEEVFDTVIVAIGQQTDLTGVADSGVECRRGVIAGDDQQATSLDGVFAAGDCAGPLNTVVKAVGSGKAAAFAIDRFLTGRERPLASPLRSKLGCYDGQYSWAVAHRVEMPEQPAAERVGNFAPVELGLDDKAAAYEIMRCICAAKGGRQ